LARKIAPERLFEAVDVGGVPGDEHTPDVGADGPDLLGQVPPADPGHRQVGDQEVEVTAVGQEVERGFPVRGLGDRVAAPLQGQAGELADASSSSTRRIDGRGRPADCRARERERSSRKGPGRPHHGRSMRKVVPAPGAESIPMRPPTCVTMLYAWRGPDRFPCRALGREKRLEDVLLHLVGHPAAAVRHGQPSVPDRRRPGAGGDRRGGDGEGSPSGMASRALTARFITTCSNCPRSIRTRIGVGASSVATVTGAPRSRRRIPAISVITAFRSRTTGLAACRRPKVRSWRTKSGGPVGRAPDLVDQFGRPGRRRGSPGRSRSSRG